MSFFSNISLNNSLDMMPSNTKTAASLRVIVFCLFTVFGTLSLALEPTGSYFDWGRGQDGYGYCYEYASTGDVLNQGRPQSNYYCERYSPSYFAWGRGMNGYGYCYQLTPRGDYMNLGQPQSNYQCEASDPSYYSWGRGQDGNTYCYQLTGTGLYMNEGNPVSNWHCQ